jgi:phage FluMu protein Com
MAKIRDITEEEDKKIGLNQMCQTQQIHCGSCGRFLGYQAIMLGVVKLLCPNCKEWTTIEIVPEK